MQIQEAEFLGEVRKATRSWVRGQEVVSYDAVS